MSITRNQISLGSNVKIVLRNRKDYAEGIVEEILTKAQSHPHGIMVKLNDGQIGRVREIINSPHKVNNSESFKDILEYGEYSHYPT